MFPPYATTQSSSDLAEELEGDDRVTDEMEEERDLVPSEPSLGDLGEVGVLGVVGPSFPWWSE